jgi:hypothetical protein
VRSRQTVVFVALVALCVLGAGLYVALAAGDGAKSAATLPAQEPASSTAADTPLDPKLRIAVRAADRSDPRLPGKVYVVNPSHPDRRTEYPVECMRISWTAGHGLCLSLAPSGVEYRVAELDSGFKPHRSAPLTGIPSRTRISPDGRYGAYTVFVTGDSYTAPGQFSTRTSILDMATGKPIADLERFTVVKDGQTIHASDFNFWGATFAADSDRFYATLATGGHHYLVQGSVSKRRMTVLRDGVECPSLSPDGTRIGFKRTLAGKGHWRFSVLDLATLKDHPLSETRSVDDQLEWLDDAHLSYGDGKDVWMVDADGGGTPKLLLRGASSAVAIRR